MSTPGYDPNQPGQQPAYGPPPPGPEGYTPPPFEGAPQGYDPQYSAPPAGPSGYEQQPPYEQAPYEQQPPAYEQQQYPPTQQYEMNPQFDPQYGAPYQAPPPYPPGPMPGGPMGPPPPMGGPPRSGMPGWMWPLFALILVLIVGTVATLIVVFNKDDDDGGTSKSSSQQKDDDDDPSPSRSRSNTTDIPVAGTPTLKNAGAVQKFGDKAKYSDDISVTVETAEEFTPSSYYVNDANGRVATKVTVGIRNDSDKVFDLGLVLLYTKAGDKGLECESLYDSAKGVSGISGSATPGNTSTGTWAFWIPEGDKQQVTIEVALDFDRPRAIFEGKVG